MVRQYTYLFLAWKKRFTAILGLMAILMNISAQTIPSAFDKLAQRLQPVTQHRPAELVYLSTSKGTYETLEDLWFKAYILDAQSLSLTLRGKTLYAQLVGEVNGRVYKQECYEIINGMAACHLFLPDSLPEGNYLLRAFTPWSADGGSQELKAVRRVKLIKQLKVDHVRKATTPVTYSGKVQFSLFPEGGDLVEGVNCRVAFKAVDTLGMPVETKGTLFDGKTPLLRFVSRHAGMGYFEFTPGEGKIYHIRLDSPDTTSVYPLPKPRENGISFRLVSQTKDTAVFLMSKRPGGSKNTMYVRGQSKGTVYCMARATLKDSVRIRMPLSDFPVQGIAEFTLFNDSLEPVAERLIYVHPDKSLRIEARSDKQLYMAREKVTVKIKVSGEDGQPVMANLGVSIYDKLYQAPNDPVNILSYCYLSSQLKGKLYDPAYYFDIKNADRKEALDLLLLTQGWRRYVWEEGALGVNPAIPALQDGTPGKVYATKRRKEAQKTLQALKCFCPEKDTIGQFIVANDDGSFLVAPENFKACQGYYVYIKPMAPERFGPQITLSKPFAAIDSLVKGKTVSYPQTGERTVNEKTDNYAERINAIKLQEVTVNAKTVSRFRGKYLGQLETEAWHSSTTDYECWECGHFSKEHPPRKDDILVLNCSWHKTDKTHKPVEGRMYAIRHDEHVIENYFMYGEEIIYHYPKYTEEELLKMNNLTRVKAYYPNRQFYQPNYDKDTATLQEPDFRNTLLWAPSVTTDEKGEVTLEFYCSDINSRFAGTIEGVGPEGLLGTKEMEFVVKKKTL